jgi:HK97 family phage prohead protease
MPYYVTNNARGCDDWAVVDIDGDLIGCHDTKQQAIDQMVAVSQSEGIEPGGELSGPKPKLDLYKKGTHMIKLHAQQFSIDKNSSGEPRRTISGVAVPYNTFAVVTDNTEVMFKPGSLPIDGKAPRLFMYHDASQPVGVVTERVETPEAMLFSAKISATTLGNDALVMAADGTIDQVSVGVNPKEFSFDEAGRMIITAADWVELSLVPVGAFGDAANITKVAASIHHPAATIGNTEQVTETETQTMTTETTAVASIEATIPTPALPAQAKRKFDLPTAAEYLAAIHIGGETLRNVQAAVKDFVTHKQSALQAAAGDVLTTDTPGLLPVPVLGPVMANLGYQRPVVTAVGARAMPDGGNSKTFIRPTWTTHPSVGAQSTELTAVSSTTPVIASNVVTKTTLAGQVTLSVQDIDFTSPAAMEIILQDLVGQYMLQSDAVACAAILAGDTASGSTWSVTAGDPSSLISAIYDAATDILSATNFLPDTVFVSPDVWQKLGSQLDDDKRPVFPYTGAAGLMGINGMGTANVTVANTFNPFGLNLVADRAFSNNTLVVGRAAAVEFYEQIRGLMSVEVPGTLGRTFSYYGYVATFIPYGSMLKSIAIA